jgi:hypothetical protein
LWIPQHAKLICRLGDSASLGLAAFVVLQVTRFQVFVTLVAKFNKIVTILAASVTNKGFPQTAELGALKEGSGHAFEMAHFCLNFLD